MMDGGALISEPQGAVYDAHDMIRLDTMQRQIQRMLSDKVGSLLNTTTGEVAYITDCPSIVVRGNVDEPPLRKVSEMAGRAKRNYPWGRRMGTL